MNKKQSYHISIKNLETKKEESFLLSPSSENPLKVVGVDNLAPKYQVGKMEYGDFTNHSVWAQGSWAEGGGAEFWDPFKDGYNVYPFTKKYFSKSGLRTIDYPGKLVLGANASLIENFPEEEGYVAKILRYSQSLFVAINLTDSCKIYRTDNGGLNWYKIYDSAEQPTNESSSYDLRDFKEITDMSVGFPDATDLNLPDRGSLNVWDNYWQERRVNWANGGLFVTLKKNSLFQVIALPYTNYFYRNNSYNGLLSEPVNKEYLVERVEDDYDSSFNCTVFLEPVTNGKGVTMAEDIDMDRFFVGQRVDIYNGESKLTSQYIEAIQNSTLLFESSGFGAHGEARTLKFSNLTKVVILNQPITQLQMGRDQQGNGLNLHPFEFNIRNKSKNETGFVRVSCGNGGVSHSRKIQRTYTGYSSVRQTMDNGGDTDFYYTQYFPPVWVPGEGENPGYYLPEERGGYWVNQDSRNYVVISNYLQSTIMSVEVGDALEVHKVIKVANGNAEKPMAGIYTRKNTTVRSKDLFYNGSSRLWRVKFPTDLNYYSNESSIWFSYTGQATAYYINEQQRELVLGSRNTNLVQSYIYEVDDSTTGAASSVFDVGELTISTIVKHNESIFVGTNDKGRIYEWNNQTYRVLERFSLDPLTNSHLILASEVFQNKILMTDNFNGRIMSYDPEEDIWDDLCSPEYIHERGNLITSIGMIGGTLFFGTNRTNNLFWKFDENNMSDNGFVISSWYDADMPAIDKRGLYIQVLAEQFIRSGAKVRVAVQFDFQDGWYYMSTKRGQLQTKTPNKIHEATYEDIKTNRALYFFFPYDTPKWKTARYRMEIYGGKYRTKQGRLAYFRPVINNIDIFYILTDPKEYYFTYPIILENRQQLLDGPGSNEIGRHRDKLDFLLDIWNNDTMVEITHINGEKYTCIPFKPVQMTGGGMSVIYQNIDPSRVDLDKLSFLATLSFKNINKVDNFG